MISFENVSKSYTKELLIKSTFALQDVSFNLPAGETLGLIGANGAGKTTSIRLLMDFIRPDKGTINLFGLGVNDVRARSRVGYLPETASFPSNLNIMDLIRFTSATCNISSHVRKNRGTKLLQDLDLWEVRQTPLRTYSKGMQQRANFVLALLNDPQLLILDEPMSGLDPMGRKKIIDLIENLKNKGKTILFCSHILEDVDRLVDNILVLHKGKKLFYGSPTTLTSLENKKTMAEAFVSMVEKEMASA